MRGRDQGGRDQGGLRTSQSMQDFGLETGLLAPAHGKEGRGEGAANVILRWVVALLLGFPPLHALAQAYPVKPVRAIVGSAPGGGSDVLGRIVTQGLSDLWQQPVVVDNRGGGGGVMAIETALRAAPDGYTVLVGSFGIAYVGALRKNLSFNVTRDLAPIALLASQPFVLAIPSAVPVDSVAGLIQLAKSKAGQLNYGTTGAGSASHLGTELFSSIARIQLVPVNYKGLGPALVGLVGGEVHVGMVGVSTVLPQLKTKRIKALGVTSAKRSALLAEVPTIGETLPGFEFDVWYAMFAPAAMPKDLTQKINATVNQVLQQPAVRERIAASGAEPGGGSEEKFVNFFRSEVAKWHKVIQNAGIRAD